MLDAAVSAQRYEECIDIQKRIKTLEKWLVQREALDVQKVNALSEEDFIKAVEITKRIEALDSKISRITLSTGDNSKLPFLLPSPHNPPYHPVLGLFGSSMD